MLALVTPDEMGEIDRAAPEPVEVLISRAGAALERAAVSLMGGTYGRRVVVIAGPGNNGADGRDSARRLMRRGVRTSVVEAADVPQRLSECDLVIDAAFGTGFRGTWRAPALPQSAPPVLAVDIPSGVDGLTGAVSDHSDPLAADLTDTFAALKPGLVFGAGRELAGEVQVADIGLDVSASRCHLVGAAEMGDWYRPRDPAEHKWRSAVWAIGASKGMEGALALTAAGAQRAGAGYVRCSSPGLFPTNTPGEVVRTQLPTTGWAAEVGAELERFAAVAVGNGLGRDPAHRPEVWQLLTTSSVPVVADADALVLLGEMGEPLPATQASRVVLTPHDGEYRHLCGEAPGADRVGATRALALRCGAVVLLKGPTTVVAHPDGRALVVASGDARLATAGTGDVLSGIVSALCARGLEPLRAAGLGAYLHGAAARLGWRHGLVASDLPEMVPRVLDGELPGEL